MVEAFFEAVKPSEISLLEEILAARSADRERLLGYHRDSVKTAAYEVRLAEKRYRSVDPENWLVAAELEKGWEAALRSLFATRETAESPARARLGLQGAQEPGEDRRKLDGAGSLKGVGRE